jgi:hypothetical protein
VRASRSLLAATAVAACLVPAVPASAASLTSDRACYIERQDVALAGAGFTGSGPVSISGTQIALSGNANPDGTLSATAKAPLLGTIKPTSRTITISARDSTTNEVVPLKIQVTTAAFATSTGFKSPKAVRTWKFSGLFQNPGKPIYGHFRHRGRTYANYRFGVPTGPCGKLTKRAPGIPARNVPSGLWTVQVDFRKTYSAKASPRLSGTTSVITTFRRR